MDIKDNRLHKLLGIILQEFTDDKGTTSIRYDWTFEDLATQYGNTNIHEIGELCKILGLNHLLTKPSTDTIHLDHNHLRWARQAYHSGKFKEKPDWINRFNLSLGVINIGILIYSAIIAYKTDDKVDMLSTTVASQVKNLEKKNVTLDSLKKEIFLNRQQIDSLTKELKVKK